MRKATPYLVSILHIRDRQYLSIRAFKQELDIKSEI